MNLSDRNRNKAEQWFVQQGLMPPKEERTERWVLHHKDESLRHNDRDRYEEWNVDDLVPMSNSEHMKFHQGKEKNSMYGHIYSQETIQKQREAKLGKKQSKEHIQKNTENKIGRHWYHDDDGNEYFRYECPDGCKKGRKR